MMDKGRVAWWQDNKAFLIEKYNVPFIGSKYPWSVLIGEVGDGFQFLQHRASDNDLICFDSLKPGANCAEKNGCYGYRTSIKSTPDTLRMIVNIFSVVRMLKLSVLLIKFIAVNRSIASICRSVGYCYLWSGMMKKYYLLLVLIAGVYVFS